MKMGNRPLLIVTSSTRNYGWVTRAFLEGNSRWADYIIVVDQMSTDGSRVMFAEYNLLKGDGVHRAEIVIIDDADMSYKENIRAKMAFMRGRELAAGRNAIYFALDIDEVMPANWQRTDDGQKILASNPGDMFQIEWANLQSDNRTFRKAGWQYKIFHDNGMAWQEADIQMHTPLLPYSSWNVKMMNSVQDFPLLHFGVYHHKWIYYKTIYYQMLDVHQHRSKSAVSLYRTYHGKGERNDINCQPLQQEWLYKDTDMFALIDISSTPIFVEYMRELIREDGPKKFVCLDIWDDDIQKKLAIKDIRPFYWKMRHWYLRKTNKWQSTFVIHALDFVLKRVY